MNWLLRQCSGYRLPRCSRWPAWAERGRRRCPTVPGPAGLLPDRPANAIALECQRDRLVQRQRSASQIICRCPNGVGWARHSTATACPATGFPEIRERRKRPRFESSRLAPTTAGPTAGPLDVRRVRNRQDGSLLADECAETRSLPATRQRCTRAGARHGTGHRTRSDASVAPRPRNAARSPIKTKPLLEFRISPTSSIRKTLPIVGENSKNSDW